MSISNISYNGAGAGIRHAYPYTDFHEMNLDWILTTYQAIVDKLNETINWANTHQTEYEEAIARLTAVENEIATFEAQVNAAFERLQAQFEAEFEAQKAEMEAALAAAQAEMRDAIRQMQVEVTQELAQFYEQFQVLKSEIQAEVNAMLATVTRAIDNLYEIMQSNNQYVFDYVALKLEEFRALIPDYENIYVYNPFRGEQTLLQVAINDIYSVACIWGLTAEQYDSLELTASEYDALGLTAQEYDTFGYKLLYKDPDLYMINPFTGTYDPIKSVINDLAALHKTKAYTATEYDALDLDADTYDGYELEAYFYDWFGKDYIPA